MSKLSILFILFTVSTNAQISGTIRDSITKQPVQYANIWLENQNIGTTLTSDGNFDINKKISSGDKISVNVLGYEAKTVAAKENLEVLLMPTSYLLDEVAILDKKNKSQITIGKFKKSDVSLWFGTGTASPITYAKFIPPSKETEEHPFIKTIEIHTMCRINKAVLKLRVLDVDKDKVPGEDLTEEVILMNVSKGNRISKINLEEYNISIPADGIFIAFEWMIIDENIYRYWYTSIVNGIEKKYEDGLSYEPCIGTIPSEVSNTWTKQGGKWRKMIKLGTDENRKSEYDGKYGEIAIKITLTD